MMCYDFLLFIHILEDVPFSKGTRADFQQKVSFFVLSSFHKVRRRAKIYKIGLTSAHVNVINKTCS